MQQLCNSCPRNCGAIRTENGNKGGFCGMSLLPKIARADLHFWEEPCISGSKGSGTIFFSGCSLRCVYCQNFEISHLGGGEIVGFEALAQMMQRLENAGAHNINFVNPTHYIYAIKEALKIYRPKIPLVYNSGGYDSAAVINEDIFDIYLMDIKYVSPEKSLKYSGVDNYFSVASKAVSAAAKLKGTPILNEEGIMLSGVIVRHLVLPQSTREAIAVIDWVQQNAPNVYLSIMSQYIPCGKAADYPEINRVITKREYDKILDYALASGLNNIFIQDRCSADKNYIPNFNWGIDYENGT